MTGPSEIVTAVELASNWDARVAVIRSVPELFGAGAQPAVYRDIAQRVYVPNLRPDFAYVHWRDEYEIDSFKLAYQQAHQLTTGFQRVSVADLASAIATAPTSLKVFRTILGFTTQEFAATTVMRAVAAGVSGLSASRLKSIEAGARVREAEAQLCAEVIDKTISGELFPIPTPDIRPKTDKPDTEDGWTSIREMAEKGVPYSVFLHQRHYGGAFRQLLDATSTQRGNILEEAVATLFDEQGVPYVRTASANQEEIKRRFGLTVTPAPDFVVYDSGGILRAMLECKGANDGGTARDKAARFRALRQEGVRLGGTPVFAVLAGLGWTRAGDALGPVVQATDGRVFTLADLDEMMTVQPFPALQTS